MDTARLSTLLSLDPEDRYWHTVDRVAQTGVLWGLHGDQGWFTPVAPEGFDFIPLWPDKALAQLVADLLYPGNSPKKIPLDQYRAEWIDELEESGVRIGVFPDAEGAFWETGPLELFDAIEDTVQSQI
ncbi:DUF2750 domain-containing protein [Oceaniglobus ichthyenteri]|uniref:DUF2750 domain-containing protein n=1 Tax=Oceaniglobus ichthyenteri TaxID=2136177 RepID=UPI000D388107|nr:DUF2750 domain-containing protein [Oceaniglobus ichthyenteri]